MISTAVPGHRADGDPEPATGRAANAGAGTCRARQHQAMDMEVLPHLSETREGPLPARIMDRIASHAALPDGCHVLHAERLRRQRECVAARARGCEERRLVRLARRAGYFRARMGNGEILAISGYAHGRAEAAVRAGPPRDAPRCSPGAAPGTPGARRCSTASSSPSAGAGQRSTPPWRPTSGSSCGRIPARGTLRPCPGSSPIPGTGMSSQRPRTHGRRRGAHAPADPPRRLGAGLAGGTQGAARPRRGGALSSVCRKVFDIPTYIVDNGSMQPNMVRYPG